MIREDIMQLLKRQPKKWWTIKDIADALGVSRQHVATPLSHLHSNWNLLERKHEGKISFYRLKQKAGRR